MGRDVPTRAQGADHPEAKAGGGGEANQRSDLHRPRDAPPRAGPRTDREESDVHGDHDRVRRWRRLLGAPQPGTIARRDTQLDQPLRSSREHQGGSRPPAHDAQSNSRSSTISPGPNAAARPWPSDEGRCAARSSSTNRIAADDVLPTLRMTPRVAVTWDARRPRQCVTESTIALPPGWSAITSRSAGCPMKPSTRAGR